MSEPRDVILGRIRAALGEDPAVPAVPRDYHRPDSGPADHDRLALLRDRLEDYRATVYESTVDSLASVVADLVAGAGRVVVPPGLPDWAPPGLTVDSGLSPVELDGFDTVLTTAAAACAETGTIVLDAGPGQGRRAVSLVPDRHVCVLRADQVVATVPELLARLDPQRPLTFISGPSATSDIELHRVEGVHGPRTLIVVLVA
jgi:L-lactate dehydrogenase complex protein LldG